MENLEQEKSATEALKLHEGHDEDFDEEGEEMMDENHPMWRSERITLNSVGIDIGSSTSHLIFSRLTQGDSELVDLGKSDTEFRNSEFEP